MPKADKHIYVGIDPGVQTGLAVYNRSTQKLVLVTTTVFWETMDHVEMLQSAHGTALRVVIEDPGLNKPVFTREVNKASMLRIAQNVGFNKAHAALLIEGMERKGIDVLTVRPTTTKTKAPEFKRKTGYDKRTSQHGRDAAMLVWGI